MVRRNKYLVLVCVVSLSTSAVAQQRYAETILDETEIPAICGNLKELSSKYQGIVNSWETVQKNLVECTSANCEPETVDGYRVEAEHLDRYRKLLEQRLAIEEKSYVGTISKNIETSDDEPVFVLGERLYLGGIDFAYVASPFPIHVVQDEARYVGEVRGRDFAPGGDLRLFLRIERAAYNSASQHQFYYSLAGQVGEICGALEKNDGLILEIGITFPNEGQTPLGLDMQFKMVALPRLVGKNSTVNHFLTVGPLFQAFFSRLPHRKEAAEEYRGFCRFQETIVGDLFAAVGSVRSALSDAVGGGDWPTERQLFASSNLVFGRDQEEIVTIELAWNEKPVGVIVISNSYDREDWPYKFNQRVVSIYQNGELIYGCKRD